MTEGEAAVNSAAWLELLVIFVLILLNGFFAGAEIAILTARKGRLESEAEEGRRSARLALDLARDPNRFLATVQAGITLVGTFAAVFGGARLVEQLSELLRGVPIEAVSNSRHGIAMVVVTGGIAFLSLVFGELVPKRFALGNAERLATLVAYPMYLVGRVTLPFVRVLGFITQVVLRLLGSRGAPQAAVSLEDIQHLIETGRAEGLVQPTAERMAIEALQLGERTVRDILRPRVDIDALDIDTPPGEVLALIATSGYSRLPVYQDTLDHVLGFVYIKDVVRRLNEHQPLDLRQLFRPAIFVPETMRIGRLLERFGEEQTQLAIVLDEYGGTEGIVTIEDVLEELVGQIHDEHRADQEQRIVQRTEDSWLVDGGLTLRELEDLLQPRVEWGEEFEDVTTISGVILALLQRLPKIGDAVEWGHLRLEVMDMDGRRIDRVLVQLPPPGPRSDESA